MSVSAINPDPFTLPIIRSTFCCCHRPKKGETRPLSKVAARTCRSEGRMAALPLQKQVSPEGMPGCLRGLEVGRQAIAGPKWPPVGRLLLSAAIRGAVGRQVAFLWSTETVRERSGSTLRRQPNVSTGRSAVVG